MDFFGLLNMIGGLALFLYGMNAMGEGLAKTAGGRLEKILETLTSNRLKAVVLGAVVTAVIQSSSATTVMVVGFVNSGIMNLSQAVGVIFGANIGTTITSWILSLSAIESADFFVKLLKPTSFSPVLAIIGVIFITFIKSEKKKDIGQILVGFAILMFGMNTMSSAVKPLAEVEAFTNLFVAFKNPILGMLVGAVLTAVIQSSSASVGILQAMCATGAVSYGAAIPIILGQNIGTCATAMISGLGANKNARRASLLHLYFNVVATVLFMVVFYAINAVLDFAFLDSAIPEVGVAVIHSVFNVTATLILLPFADGLVKLACLTVKDTEEESVYTEDEAGLKLLDARFLERPAFAVAQSKSAAIEMSKVVSKALSTAIDLFEDYKEENVQKVMDLEDIVDRYEDELGNYLVKLSAKTLTEKDNHTITTILHTIGDFERMADHAINIAETAREMNSKEDKFSKKALAELEVMTNAVKEILDTTFRVFAEEDVSRACNIEPLEEVIDDLKDEMKHRHVKRLSKGKCTIELGFAYSDLITNYERIADHCSNVAVAIFQIADEAFETHESLDFMKKNDADFKKLYATYSKVYQLP